MVDAARDESILQDRNCPCPEARKKQGTSRRYACTEEGKAEGEAEDGEDEEHTVASCMRGLNPLCDGGNLPAYAMDMATAILLVTMPTQVEALLASLHDVEPRTPTASLH